MEQKRVIDGTLSPAHRLPGSIAGTRGSIDGAPDAIPDRRPYGNRSVTTTGK
jgi:hypothetical protein